MATQMAAYAVFTAEVIAASGSATSAAIPIDKADALALHLTSIAGTAPSVTFTYSLSMSADGTYVIPNVPVTIGATVASDDVMDFAPEAARFIKITATNNNGSNGVTISAILAVQEKG